MHDGGGHDSGGSSGGGHHDSGGSFGGHHDIGHHVSGHGGGHQPAGYQDVPGYDPYYGQDPRQYRPGGLQYSGSRPGSPAIKFVVIIAIVFFVIFVLAFV